MIIAGFIPESFVDWRGRIVATIFTYGCNLRCPFCHNFSLVTQPIFIKYSDDDVIRKIRDIEEWIDGICITGGEPTLHRDIVEFVKKLSKIKPVKLDTNGTKPEILAEIIKYVEYVAMDIKAPAEKYRDFTGREVDIQKIEKSIKIIMKNAKDYEFRTTFIPTLSEKDIEKISLWIKGAKRYVIQQFSTVRGTLDPNFRKLKPHNSITLKKACKLASKNVMDCLIVND